MQVIVEVTSERRTFAGRNPYFHVIEVHARRLLDWRKAGKDGRIVDDKYVGEKKSQVREFVVEVDDYTDKDIADYKEVMEKEHK